jgi:hypothetical protein
MARIQAEAGRILAAEAFVRSPVLSRLFTFLVERTTAGEPIKSYTIAVEGLGRSEDESDEADTYARVAVGRLRRALSSYYEAQPLGDRLCIDKGTYEVRLVQGAAGPDTVDPGSRQSGGLPVFGISLKWLTALAFLLVVAAIAYDWWSDRKEAAWTGLDLPTVSVEASTTGPVSAAATVQLEAHRQELIEALSRYFGLRVVEGAGRSEFIVQLHLIPAGQGGNINVTMLERVSRRVVWAHDMSLGSGRSEAATDEIAASVASPGGVLSGFLRRQGYTTNSPRGCWLQFTAGVQTFNTLGDKELAACARAWYRAAPQRPTSAFLYGWTLTDRSAWELHGARRRTLEEAVEVLRKAVSLNPDMAPLNLALTRAYAFAGERELVVQTAADTVETGRSNRLVQGMAASLLTFWNDPSGEVILRELNARQGDNYPWEHVGLFIAAMMRDDLASGRPHIEHLERSNTGQPLLLLLRAAYFGRAGDRRESEEALLRLQSDPRIRIAGVDSVVNQLPMAPEVKRRLSHWISSGR